VRKTQPARKGRNTRPLTPRTDSQITCWIIAGTKDKSSREVRKYQRALGSAVVQEKRAISMEETSLIESCGSSRRLYKGSRNRKLWWKWKQTRRPAEGRIASAKSLLKKSDLMIGGTENIHAGSVSIQKWEIERVLSEKTRLTYVGLEWYTRGRFLGRHPAVLCDFKIEN